MPVPVSHTSYLCIEKYKKAQGNASPIMACVEGIPYSSSYLFSILITGGVAGLGSLKNMVY